MRMKIPANVEIHHDPGATWWVDEDGILCSIGKKNPPKLTKEEEERELKKYKDRFGDKKLCMLLDIMHLVPPSKEERDKASVQMERMVKALAIILYSPLGRMVANLFFGLTKPSYPVKMFGNEKDAKEWLRQYL
jgi:hypothetical protein